jgi:hypothetical protein
MTSTSIMERRIMVAKQLVSQTTPPIDAESPLRRLLDVIDPFANPFHAQWSFTHLARPSHSRLGAGSG